MSLGQFPVTSLGAIPFARTNLESAAHWLIDCASGRDQVGIPVRLSNAYCVALADKDPEYRSLFKEGVTFPDGLPVAKMLNVLGSPDARRVRGPSLFERTLEVSQDHPVRHYFLGGSTETLKELSISLGSRFPRLRVAGMHSPPFAPIDELSIDDWCKMILDADATIVWVSLGTPKQDFAASALASRLNVPVVAVGAAFDFFAGTSREAPQWMQNSGTEWIFRLATEPRRLWKRYFLGNSRFLWVSLRSLLQGIR